ncbi:MAG: GNAT family N-acetyltransferase [Microlunatus sp.]
MDIALDRARVGERWVLRCRQPDGSATDVTGWLVSVSADAVVIEPVGQAPRTIGRATIILAKRVPAAAGGPDPRRTPAEDLARSTLAGWVADSEPLGEWTLRTGGGFTSRANSALAIGDPGLPLPQAAERVIAYAGAHAITPRAQVIVGSAVDRGLMELGWTPVHVIADVLVVRLTTLLGDELPDPRVEVTQELDSSWLAAFGRSRPTDADPGVVRQILTGRPTVGFAAVRASGDGEGRIAIARGHVDGFWLGLMAIWTEPEHRRLGLATAMMHALGHWAARRGARYAYLQVAEQNQAAQQAYARLGFVQHHSYRYLAPSTPELLGFVGVARSTDRADPTNPSNFSSEN